MKFLKQFGPYSSGSCATSILPTVSLLFRLFPSAVPGARRVGLAHREAGRGKQGIHNHPLSSGPTVPRKGPDLTLHASL